MFFKLCVDKVEVMKDGVIVIFFDGCMVDGSYCFMVVGFILNIVGIGFEEVGVEFDDLGYVWVNKVVCIFVFNVYVVGDCMNFFFLVFVVLM